MTPYPEVDAQALLEQVAAQVPASMRENVVVIGSIATAWIFRDVSGTHTVATKDIDLLLRPAIEAVVAAQALAEQLLQEGWKPHLPDGRQLGTSNTRDEHLPALRLKPPGGEQGWFVELQAAPPDAQIDRRHWRRFQTSAGIFGLPSFRSMPVAIHGAEETPSGLRVARAANMALAHLLEHADPDRTPISNLAGNPARFIKDVGRAVALWWLANQQSENAKREWRTAWDVTFAALDPHRADEMDRAAHKGLDNLAAYLSDAHRIALGGVLAPHGTTPEAWRRAFASLQRLFDRS